MKKGQEDVDVESESASVEEDDDSVDEGSSPEGDGTQKGAKQSRAEKKSRKAVQKLGMKQVTGILRVTVKKSKNILFVISKPDVFRAPASDTYVIFGEAKIEDLSAQAQASAAQQLAQSNVADVTAVDPHPMTAMKANKSMGEEKIEEVDETDIDESGLEPKDIDLVMAQVKCSRAKAVAALKANNHDIVEAIMTLSPG
eukprot:Filipodium_phascolosomae@DN1962_c0_g1_i2.p1